MREPATYLSSLKIQSILEAADPALFPEFLKLAATELEARDRLPLMLCLPEVWAAVDRQAAMMAFIHLHLDPDQGLPRLMTTQAYQKWQDTSPTAARQWLVEHQNNKDFEDLMPTMITSVAGSLLQESEGAVIDWAASLDGDNYKSAALNALWSRFLFPFNNQDHSAGLRQLFDTFAGISDPSLARLAAKSCAGSWGGVRPDEFLKILHPPPGQSGSAAQAALLSGLEVISAFRMTGKTIPPSELLSLARKAGELSAAECRVALAEALQPSDPAKLPQ